MLSILMNIHEYNKQQTQREELSLFKLIFYVCYKKHTNSLQANLGQVNIKCSKKGQDKKLFSLRYILLNSVVIRHSSAESDSAVSMKSLSLTLWCQWHRRVGLHGVNEIAELDSAVSMTPRSPTLRCQWNRWAWLSGIIDTTESDYAVSHTPQSQNDFSNINIFITCETLHTKV